MVSLIQNLLLHYFKTPQYLILFTHGKCWSRCSHCWYNDTWKNEHNISGELTFNEFEKLAQSIDKLSFLSLTGGEAFLREDIVEIARLFASEVQLKRYQIPTSGFGTDLIIKKTEQLLNSNRSIPFRVDVSLDGTQETHDRIRNLKGCFSNALTTIKALTALKKCYPHFDVGVITTISNENQHEIKEIAAIIEKYHLHGEWMVNIVRGKPRDPSVVQVDPENYDLAAQLIKQRIRHNSYTGHSGHFSAPWLSAKNIVRRKLISSILHNKTDHLMCSAGALGGVIYNNGDVYPCEMVNQSFGNLRDFNYDLQKVWYSDTAEKFRSSLKNGNCICTQECFLSLNVMLEPAYWPEIIVERIRLHLHSKHAAQ
jgi:MoaA/NifB/PqqE/SkfB family radical SAM enzyme